MALALPLHAEEVIDRNDVIASALDQFETQSSPKEMPAEAFDYEEPTPEDESTPSKTPDVEAPVYHKEVLNIPSDIEAPPVIVSNEPRRTKSPIKGELTTSVGFTQIGRASCRERVCQYV